MFRFILGQLWCNKLFFLYCGVYLSSWIHANVYCCVVKNMHYSGPLVLQIGPCGLINNLWAYTCTEMPDKTQYTWFTFPNSKIYKFICKYLIYISPRSSNLLYFHSVLYIIKCFITVGSVVVVVEEWWCI